MKTDWNKALVSIDPDGLTLRPAPSLDTRNLSDSIDLYRLKGIDGVGENNADVVGIEHSRGRTLRAWFLEKNSNGTSWDVVNLQGLIGYGRIMDNRSTREEYVPDSDVEAHQIVVNEIKKVIE